MAGKSKPLTPELAEAIVKDFAAGITKSYAGADAGATSYLVKKWLARGEEWAEDPDEAPEDERIYAQFAADVEEAERKFLRACMLKAVQHSQQGRSVPTLLDILARRAPEEWGKKLDGGDGAPQLVINVPPWAQPKQLGQGEIVEGEITAEN